MFVLVDIDVLLKMSLKKQFYREILHDTLIFMGLMHALLGKKKENFNNYSFHFITNIHEFVH